MSGQICEILTQNKRQGEMTENKMQAIKFLKYGISITLTLSSAEEGSKALLQDTPLVPPVPPPELLLVKAVLALAAVVLHAVRAAAAVALPGAPPVAATLRLCHLLLLLAGRAAAVALLLGRRQRDFGEAEETIVRFAAVLELACEGRLPVKLSAEIQHLPFQREFLPDGRANVVVPGRPLARTNIELAHLPFREILLVTILVDHVVTEPIHLGLLLLDDAQPHHSPLEPEPPVLDVQTDVLSVFRGRLLFRPLLRLRRRRLATPLLSSSCDGSSREAAAAAGLAAGLRSSSSPLTPSSPASTSNN